MSIRLETDPPNLVRSDNIAPISVAHDLGSTGQIHKQLKDLPDVASVVIDFTD